ncbi:hypothetical protein J8281_17975 [Aquimarina sp. U1-2]|uniref:hypothetical protein n=1 Tax=Aquimarina sp. U1-2 TaxID=2823141 RepID=UPI001AECC8AB|nr:hypothetical protein [Aquimarina sp. U1-2]MBP2834090.1 hypothetical protein [Aquimarina sp. U1-2]
MNSFQDTSRLPKFTFLILVIPLIPIGAILWNTTIDFFDVLAIAIIVLVALLCYFLKLKITMNHQNISYRLSPIIATKHLKWNNIHKIELVKAKALSTYGGWGLRYSFKNGWGYVMDSDTLMVVHKKNGKKIAFSIKDIEAFKEFAQNHPVISDKFIDQAIAVPS